MSVWLLAVAISLFFEGIMLALIPENWQQVMRQLLALPVQRLRKIGFSMIAAALAVVLLMYWWQR